MKFWLVRNEKFWGEKQRFWGSLFQSYLGTLMILAEGEAGALLLLWEHVVNADAFLRLSTGKAEASD